MKKLLLIIIFIFTMTLLLKAADIDTDNDGKISKPEWHQYHINQFDKYDTNKNGYISEKEEKNLPSGTTGGLREELQGEFTVIDTDHDGKISSIEWRGKDETFKFLDENHDGTLSEAEYTEVGARFKF